MRHLNYNHLLYFWTVANEGSIARASEVLHLTPQTISGQLKLLEDTFGEPLFQRAGRGLVLTSTGHTVHQYADEIFTLGSELSRRIRDRQSDASRVFNVGVVDSIPKLVARRILQPVLETEPAFRLSCHEGGLDHLLGELAVHRLDMVLSDRPMPPGLSVKAYNHLLGNSDVAFFVKSSKANRYRARFPQSLDKAPMLLPSRNSVLRRNLDDWFERNSVAPDVIGEFDDGALLNTFGEVGAGIFPAPVAVTEQFTRLYRSRLIGTADGVTENFYGISPERKVKNPAVALVNDSARQQLFSGDNTN